VKGNQQGITEQAKSGTDGLPDIYYKFRFGIKKLEIRP